MTTNKLTQEEKRIKIAEARGIKRIKDFGSGPLYIPSGKPWTTHVIDALPVPDYFGDLNAMHEAERWLATNTPFTTAYWRKVVEVVCYDADEPMNFDECTMFCSITANAAQRAEAFGLTLGLWEAGQ